MKVSLDFESHRFHHIPTVMTMWQLHLYHGAWLALLITVGMLTFWWVSLLIFIAIFVYAFVFA